MAEAPDADRRRAAGSTAAMLGGRSALDLRAASEDLAGRLPPLLVEAERVASTVAQGVHGRRRVGMGETFWQYRVAREGDPSTSIDWRASARSDRLYVRENEWEAAETVWLWCDRSDSMVFASRKDVVEKARRAGVITLALASLLVRGGERVGVISHAMGTPKPMTGRRAIDNVLEALLGPTRSMSLPPDRPLPRHSRLVLVSDFLSPLEGIERTVRAHAARGVVGHLVQILDPAEEDLPYDGRTEFEDLEDAGSAIFDRPQDLRAAYRAKITAHKAALADMARAVGWTFATHRTDAAAEPVMLALYTTLAGARASGRA